MGIQKASMLVHPDIITYAMEKNLSYTMSFCPKETACRRH